MSALDELAAAAAVPATSAESDSEDELAPESTSSGQEQPLGVAAGLRTSEASSMGEGARRQAKGVRRPASDPMDVENLRPSRSSAPDKDPISAAKDSAPDGPEKQLRSPDDDIRARARGFLLLLAVGSTGPIAVRL